MYFLKYILFYYCYVLEYVYNIIGFEYINIIFLILFIINGLIIYIKNNNFPILYLKYYKNKLKIKNIFI